MAALVMLITPLAVVVMPSLASAEEQQPQATELTNSEIAALAEEAQLESQGDPHDFVAFLEDHGGVDVTNTLGTDLTDGFSTQDVPVDAFEVDLVVVQLNNQFNVPTLIANGFWNYRDNFQGAFGPRNASAIQIEGFQSYNDEGDLCWDWNDSSSSLHTWDYQDNLTSDGGIVETYRMHHTTEGSIQRYDDGSSLDIGMWADHGSHVFTISGFVDLSTPDIKPVQGCGYDDGDAEGFLFNYHHSHNQGNGSVSVTFNIAGWGLQLNLSGSPLILTKSSTIVSPTPCDEWEGDPPAICGI